MSGHHPFRFPFQDNDVSDDELSAPLSMMSLNSPADDSDAEIGVRSFFLSDDDLSDDDEDDHEVVSTFMIPNQVNGPSAPLLPNTMASSTPLSDQYQQTRDALTNMVSRLLETEQALRQHRPLSIPPIPTPARRPIHRSFGQPARNDEPPYPNQPANWDEHHEYFLWACRGPVPVITDHLQAIFHFSPPLLRSFVRAKLNNNAKRQFEFLQAYLPGESHSMQRAEARIVLWEAGLSDPEAQEGSQRMDIPQLCPTDSRYTRPRMPRGQPPLTNWVPMHDSYLLLFLGHHPNVFLRQSSWLFDRQPTDHFVSVRMAQLPFLGISADDINDAIISLKQLGPQAGGTEGAIFF